MAVVNRVELGREIMRAFNQISRQVEVMEKDASDQNVSPYKLQDVTGAYQMVPLIAAKAQLLHALTLINHKEAH
jgi:hypothetical protein